MGSLAKLKAWFGPAPADAASAKDTKTTALYRRLLDDDGDAAATPIGQRGVAMGVGAGDTRRASGGDGKDHKAGPSPTPDVAAAVGSMDSTQARTAFSRLMKGQGIDWSSEPADRAAKDARKHQLQTLAGQMTPAHREQVLEEVWRSQSPFARGIDREGKRAAFDALCAGIDPHKMRARWSDWSASYLHRDAGSGYRVRLLWLDALRSIAQVGFAGQGELAEKALRKLAPVSYCTLSEPTHAGFLATALAPLMPRERLKAYAGEIIDLAAKLHPDECSLLLEHRAMVLLAVWDALSPGALSSVPPMRPDAMDGFEAAVGFKMTTSLQSRLHRVMVWGSLEFIPRDKTAEHLSHPMQAQALHGLGPLERERALELHDVVCRGLAQRLTRQELTERIAAVARTSDLSGDDLALRQAELDALRRVLKERS